MPLVDAVAEDWASGCMLVLTSLALELSRKFFGRDLDDACLLIRGTIAVVAVINHFEKVIELEIIIEHAKSKDLISDGILIIRIWMLRTGHPIINKKISNHATPNSGAVARFHAPPAFTPPKDQQ